MPEILEAAKIYLKKGVSIIPVKKDKVPYISWAKYQKEFPTEADLEKWWKEWPEANIGIITGKLSNLAVVDVEKGGDISRFPTTDAVRTGGGGWHFYYNYLEGVENKARVLPLTDIRGEGGYVVAPPSIHASGRKYEATEAVGRVSFPAWLFGLAKKPNNWQKIVEGVPQGARNETAAKMTGKLLRTFAPNEWGSAWLLLTKWNLTNNPPLSEYELRNTYNSIAKRELRTRGAQTEVELRKPLTFEEVIDWGVAELDALKPEDIISFGYSWLDNVLTGFFKGELVVLGGETGLGKTTFATNIMIKASQNHKCSIFALEDRLPDYGIKALYFEIGKVRKLEGKLNYPWNEYRKNAINDSKYKLYRAEARKRLANLSKEKLLFEQIDEMMDIDLLEKFITKRCEDGYELFLIDHLHYFDLLKGDISKADYIERMMVRLKFLQKRTNARILLVVHYRKLNGKKPTLDSFKDSISIVHNANYVINLWRDRTEGEDRFLTEIMIPKTRNPNGEATIQAKFNPDTNDYELVGETFGVGEKEPEEIKTEEINFGI